MRFLPLAIRIRLAQRELRRQARHPVTAWADFVTLAIDVVFFALFVLLCAIAHTTG